MPTIKVAFDIGDKVLIKELKRPGRCIGIHKGNNGLTYNITYFNDGQKRDAYCHEEDLERKKEGE